jgi:ethanolamine ammonia-lyase large subunit
MLGGLVSPLVACGANATTSSGVTLSDGQPGEDVFAYVRRLTGRFDRMLYQQIVGAANEFKEGDQILGVAAADPASRAQARQLLSHTRIGDLDAHPLFEDDLYRRLQQDVNADAAKTVAAWTLGQLRRFLLERSEDECRAIMPGLSSDVIGCLVKLLSNADLTRIGQKVFNPLPGSRIGARGYLGARIQPNSPTDHVDDIRWQVFDGWAYAVGDVVLGCNPVSSAPESVAAIEAGLWDIIQTFGLQEVLPHCVLAHIDVQAEVETRHPGTTGIWFQSLAGSTAANHTFDLTTDRMLAHAARRTGQYGLYFETGQGADFTNGHGQGTDMVIHESRKYGFARLLGHHVAAAQRKAGRPPAPWLHVNDVAGFIGPEVFRTREQLVRCCLEDIVMGKLHGLTLGLDVCSTLHMDISLDDLDWCLDQIAPACPAYLMALPTKNDPMLSYLTTGFQDHVRLRERLGCRVNDAMWQFFQRLGVIDAQGQPAAHFGQPQWVYLQYRRHKGDARPEAAILAEARAQMQAVRRRGVWLAEGCGAHRWNLEPQLDQEIRTLYADSKQCIWTELTAAFQRTIPAPLFLRTRSRDRTDYVLHPASGEQLDEKSVAAVKSLRTRHAGQWDVQIVVSDGLNGNALMDPGHLLPYLAELRTALTRAGYQVAPEHLVVTSGRVRAGYRIGELLYGNVAPATVHRGIVHVIGERPGSLHHTFSAYITAPAASVWGEPGKVDHNITKVVSGIADTALAPAPAAAETARLLETLMRGPARRNDE